MMTPAQATETAPKWAADPTDIGANLPSVGRSLFDVVFTRQSAGKPSYDIPFPFAALIRRVEARVGCSAKSRCVTPVLIPLGRSLQRTSASPDYFMYPRAVVAVTSEGGRLFLKDRLYLGYQEKAELIEVISYNEDAARFEFQLVKDYRAGGKPRVVYANRTICLACHQNHSPIFSRQVWDETNANPRVAERLLDARKDFYGIPVKRGVDIPNAIDDAVARANLLSVTQRLWQEGCGTNDACRRGVLIAALQYRLSGERGFDEYSSDFQVQVVETLMANARRLWPSGLAVPNPGIPNRDPFAQPMGASGLALSHVAAPMEPLLPRAALEVWSASDPTLAGRLVTGVAALFSEREVGELKHQLAAVKDASSKRLTAPCQIEKNRAGWRFRCKSERLMLAGSTTGRAAKLDFLAVGGGPTLFHHSTQMGRSGRDIRLHDGNAVDRVKLNLSNRPAVEINTTEDFSAWVRAKLPGTISGRLTRSALLAAIGMDPELERSFVPAEEELEARAADATAEAQVFHRHCAVCHRTHERTPPNFLHGDAARVSAALKHCAPRIFARLSMGQLAPAARDKTPMPPPFASKEGSPGEVALDAKLLESLTAAAARMLRSETGQAPVLATMLSKGYENLRPCLPAERP